MTASHVPRHPHTSTQLPSHACVSQAHAPQSHQVSDVVLQAEVVALTCIQLRQRLPGRIVQHCGLPSLRAKLHLDAYRGQGAVAAIGGCDKCCEGLAEVDGTKGLQSCRQSVGQRAAWAGLREATAVQARGQRGLGCVPPD